MDEIFEVILNNHGKGIVLDYEKPTVSGGTRDLDSDIRLIRSMLRFTSMVFSNTTNKCIYNSVEVNQYLH